MTAVIRVEGLCKAFGRTSVLDRLDLAVDEGSAYAFIGANGAGKTTTVKLLMNILEPTAGRALVFGDDARQLGPAHFQRIGYVSENQELPWWMTVNQFMAYLAPFYPTWDDRLARSLLDQLALPRDRKLKHLSRGMRMKAALASSLAYRPRLLVLDEPFSGLDPLARDEFIEGLMETAEEMTMFISSHDLAEIESFATHVGFLEGGRLRFSEHLASLSDRFREVQITVSAGPGLPPDWPAEWLRPESAASVVRFVDSAFDRERTLSLVRRHFGETVQVDVQPMSLRAIFVALARDARKAA
jgi:ABC-2 type transport system ATP-binding protein